MLSGVINFGAVRLRASNSVQNLAKVGTNLRKVEWPVVPRAGELEVSLREKNEKI